MINKATGRRLSAAAACIAILLSVTAPALAANGSLWTDNSESLYSDGRAKYVDDIVTIVVGESTSATNKSTSQVTQTEKMDSGTGTGLVGQLLQAFGIQSSDSYKGDGSTTSSGSLTTTITAKVVEVLPNGNLLVEARRSIVVNEETQSVVLSGIIRPKDISNTNTVPSTKMADAQIKYTGKGPIAARQRPGLLNKIFNWIF